MKLKMDPVSRSVSRDAAAIAMGINKVNKEILYWEKFNSKTKSVKKRLERLYTAQTHLIEHPKESMDLVKQLKSINAK